MFNYQGIERLELFFISPNVCATFLGMMILLGIGGWFFCRLIKEKKYRVLALTLITVLVIMGEIMLAITYSRGGYVGVLLSLLLIYIVSKKRIILLFFAIALLSILLVSKGFERVKSMGDIHSDASIANRIYLWQGATAIIASNVVLGVKNPGGVYSTWYKPLTIRDSYRTMINDMLTLGVNFGIGAIFLYCSSFFMIFYFTWRYHKCFLPYEALLLCFSGALFSYFICANFSTMYMELTFFTLILMLIVVAVFVVFFCVKKQLPNKLDFIIPISMAIVLCIAIYIYGTTQYDAFPYEYEYMKIENNSNIFYATPKENKKNIQIICFIPSKYCRDFYMSFVVQNYARLLLDLGYNIVVIAVDDGLSGKKNAISFLNDSSYLDRNIQSYVFGLEEGAQSAILAVTTHDNPFIKKVILENVSIFNPLKELSVIEHIDKYPNELLLIHSKKYSENSEILYQKRASKNLPTLKIEHDNSSLFPVLTSALKGEK